MQYRLRTVSAVASCGMSKKEGVAYLCLERDAWSGAESVGKRDMNRTGLERAIDLAPASLMRHGGEAHAAGPTVLSQGYCYGSVEQVWYVLSSGCDLRVMVPRKAANSKTRVRAVFLVSSAVTCLISLFQRLIQIRKIRRARG